MSSDGASANERLLAAAKQDSEDLILEIFQHPGKYDINFADGLGNTALHYAVQYGSTDVLEHILEQENCDVDIANRLERATPLHLAIKVPDADMRRYIVASLLDAGADPRARNKFGETPLDLIAPGDDGTREIFRKAQAQAQIMAAGDLVDEDDLEDGDEDGEEDEDED